MVPLPCCDGIKTSTRLWEAPDGTGAYLKANTDEFTPQSRGVNTEEIQYVTKQHFLTTEPTAFVLSAYFIEHNYLLFPFKGVRLYASSISVPSSSSLRDCIKSVY